MRAASASRFQRRIVYAPEFAFLTLALLAGLIYMSIRTVWLASVASGELTRLPPMIGDPAARTVLLSREIHNLLELELEEGEEANRRSRLLASLQNIVAGRRLVVCMTPFEARVAHVGRLEPTEDSVWDIRCQEKPALRVFCQFIEKDVLFAVTCRPRSKEVQWLGWLALGDRNSKEWKRGIAATKREWAKFFPTHSPVCGDCLDAYLSNATLE
jgi:hypothetical protein